MTQQRPKFPKPKNFFLPLYLLYDSSLNKYYLKKRRVRSEDKRKRNNSEIKGMLTGRQSQGALPTRKAAKEERKRKGEWGESIRTD